MALAYSRNVRPEVWHFSVSGLQIVASWLGYRMKKRAGKVFFPWDAIRPETWQFDDDLLELLWVLDETVNLLPQVSQLLNTILEGSLFLAVTISPYQLHTQNALRSQSKDGLYDDTLAFEMEDEDEEDQEDMELEEDE